MNINSDTIDRIVAGVLDQLAGGEGGARSDFNTETRRHEGVEESGTTIANVVTAEVLLSTAKGRSRIVVPEKAIVTPAAWDAAKERGVQIIRSSKPEKAGQTPEPTAGARSAGAVKAPLMLVVRHTEAVDQFWDDLHGSWRRELLGCPDEAASLATSAICRGEAPVVFILAEQIHRAACLANRNDRIKAVAIRDASDVRTIRKQLKANVWCVNPTGYSWFELKNVLRAITSH